MRYAATIAALMMFSVGVTAAPPKKPIVKAKPVAPTAPYDLTARNKQDIIKQVKDKLLDGESARWRWPKHVAAFGMYCGFVNAKNRMGAYTGFTPFMVFGGVGDGPKSTGEYAVMQSTFASDDVSDSDTAIVNKMCTDNGYDLSSIPPE